MEEEKTLESGQVNVTQASSLQDANMKFCKHCGQKIAKDAVLCIHCGRQVEEIGSAQKGQPNIVINNANANANANVNAAPPWALKKEKNKWVALLLCLFLGWLGAHRFYEGKIVTGILYIFTLGLFGLGVVIDFIIILFKPNPYYV